MIILKLSGGLGNQMFQYAASSALAQHHGTGLALDLSEFAHYDLRNFALDAYNLDEVTILPIKKISKLKRLLAKIKPNKSLYAEPHFYFDPEFFNMPNGTTLSGYFQSERYFQHITDNIHQQFSLKTPVTDDRIAKAKIAVSVHVRRGDYVSDAKTLATHGSLTLDYYKQAIAVMREKYGEDITLFMFSDDPDYIETAYADLSNKHIVSGNAAHEDMHLMALCDHHIIANSSFSWWGAWLNPSKDKIVIAPKQWFAPDVLKTKPIKDLIPNNWRLM